MHRPTVSPFKPCLKIVSMNGCGEEFFSCKLVASVVLVLVFLPQVVCKIPDVKCGTSDPLPILHKFHHPGDLTIAGIVSMMYMFSKPITFIECPSMDLFDGTL